jgi:hypothetical protein
MRSKKTTLIRCKLATPARRLQNTKNSFTNLNQFRRPGVAIYLSPDSTCNKRRFHGRSRRPTQYFGDTSVVAGSSPAGCRLDGVSKRDTLNRRFPWGACLRIKYSTTPEISPRFKCSATSVVRRGRQKVEEEREGLRGEPRFGGASSFAGLGVHFLSGHVADLYGFFAWR